MTITLNNNFLILYQTNACCNPEYARSGITKRIRTSSNRFNIEFNKDPTEDEIVFSEACILSSLPFLLFRKHMRSIPKVKLKRNTIISRVVPLVVPPYILQCGSAI